ncbi:MAG: hypothetical protein WAM77_01890 [Xanthobacteraceae bacterium]|jgi:hypothetical protein
MPAKRIRALLVAARERKTLKTRAREADGLADAAADPKAKRRLRQRASEARKLAEAMK